MEYSSEEQVAPVLTGLGTRAPADIFAPNPYDPVTGYAPARTGASTTGNTNTIGVFAFDTLDLGAKWQVNGGLRREHYETIVPGRRCGRARDRRTCARRT